LSAVSQGFSVIGEVKQKSPSEGILKQPYDPVALAKSYVEGGAAAISVLTDQQFFGGSFEDLRRVSEAVSVPTLCKEFIIDAKQVRAARAHGADACLLIVRILSDAQLAYLLNVIHALNMTALVEVFDETDVKRALAFDVKLIGINNRDLDSLKMDPNNAMRLKALIPEGISVLSLSGLKAPEEASSLTSLQGVLVGTALLKSMNPAKLVREFRQQGGAR
jgi:indole-3-glycerol phosphate synthase